MDVTAFQSNGNISILGVTTCSIQTFDMELKTLDADKSTWVRIFHHNNKKGTVLWPKNDSVLYYTSTDLFSRLCLLEIYRHPAGHFEFMVLQPDDEPGRTYRWTQTSNPTMEMNPVGYKTVSGYPGANSGLGRYFNTNLDIEYTFMRNGSTWWGAVGAYNKYTSGEVTGIPGFGNVVIAGSLDLYVRIDNLLEPSSVFIAGSGQEQRLYAKDIIEL